MNLLFDVLGPNPYRYSVNNYSDIRMIKAREELYLSLVLDYYKTANVYVDNTHPLVRLLRNTTKSDDSTVMEYMFINQRELERQLKIVSLFNGKYDDVTLFSASLNDNYFKSNLEMVKVISHDEVELAYTAEHFNDEVMLVDLQAIALSYAREVGKAENEGYNINVTTYLSQVVLPSAMKSRREVSVVNAFSSEETTFVNKLPISQVDQSKDILKVCKFIRKRKYSDVYHFFANFKQVVDIPELLAGFDDNYNMYTFWLQDLVMSRYLLTAMEHSRKDDKAIRVFRNIIRVRRQYVSNISKFKRRRVDYLKVIYDTEMILDDKVSSSMAKRYEEFKIVQELLRPNDELL